MRMPTATVAASAALAIVLTAAGWGGAVRGQVATFTPAPAFSGSDLTAPPAAGWPTNGGDWFNRRFSPLSKITRDNVAGLKGVWRTRLNGSGVGAQYSAEAQPLVHDGTIYLSTGADDVFAIAVESGEILWRRQAFLDPGISVVCCGWTSRGVALGDGRVYVGRLDGRLEALDQRTGAVVWSVQAERWEQGFSITSAPLYYNGLVITGFAGGEYGIRGRVKAFDAKNGALRWTFYTVPGPGEKGHETWPQNSDAWRRGGASVWQTPAVDPDLNLVYFSTGNPGPDFNGAVRPGDNLFSTSIVAVDARTGAYRWHFQQVHHDIWDYDSPSPVVLFDIEIGGQTRRALVQASKTGWAYILDRVTGQPLVGIDERAVPQEPRQATAATQPYPRGEAFVPQSIDIAPEGHRLVNQGRIFTPFWTEGLPIKPGQSGGANWPPSAYDPTTGYLYVCATDRTGVFTGGDTDNEPPPEGERYIGSRFGSVPFGESGIYSALDMRTNRLVWQQQWPERCYSGSVATAGGLVFVGRNDGRLTALDSRDGRSLWAFQTGAGMNAPVSVFERNGEQYVVAYSGGSRFAGTARGDSLWLFSLRGRLEPAEPASVQTAAPPAEAPAADGPALFAARCAACHGANREGGPGGGPALTGLSDATAIQRTITEGRNQMPPFGGILSVEQIRAISSFVADAARN